tara:strand:+ start:546 stop:707 length:162 start_codon:yes stop_codon:yes gene_type:complete
MKGRRIEKQEINSPAKTTNNFSGIRRAAAWDLVMKHCRNLAINPESGKSPYDK